MWVSRDAEGRENVIGVHLPGVGWQPLITGNKRIMELMASSAREFKREAQSKNLSQTIHLLHFTNREDIEEW